MYVPQVSKALGIGLAFSPFLVSAAPALPNNFVKQAVPTGPGSVFLGSLTWYSQQPDLVLATISNNSTTNYAVLAKNNLFDNNYAFAPLSVATLSGTPVTLVGTRYPYPDINDKQFMDFPVGAVWERYFNMSGYIPPSPQIVTPTSQCFTISIPTRVETLDLDKAKDGQHLADLFLTNGISEVVVDSNPIHMNVTVQPGASKTVAIGAAQSLPAEPSGLILAPSQQTGSILDRLEDPSPDPPSVDTNAFQIGGTTS
ncbi:MAG: hypothetical protein L6R39_000242 [Caloplaca ligustica]|nr:MAG: hypothetical protein L6R39_000242 [Caloplaca ligustica]